MAINTLWYGVCFQRSCCCLYCFSGKWPATGVRDEATEKCWLNAAHCSCLGCLNNLHDLYLYYNLNPSTTYKKKDIKLSTHRWTDELFLFLKGHHYSLHKRVYILYRMGYRLFSMQKNLVGVWPHYDLNAGFKSMRYRHIYNENP